MMKSVSRAEITDLQQIPNIGPSLAANLRLIGVLSSHDLLGKDPYKLYDGLDAMYEEVQRMVDELVALGSLRDQMEQIYTDTPPADIPWEVPVGLPERAGRWIWRHGANGTMLYFSSEDELRDLFATDFDIKTLQTVQVEGKREPHRMNFAFMERKLVSPKKRRGRRRT
ncbi:MAG: hypothetical protein KJ000_12280 [Pirellulaceae bacterium]|nr:hypothetical protein [Pirellulaceae bacterium]